METSLHRTKRAKHVFNTERIGGKRLTQNEREPYMKKLRALPKVHVHWPHQCRCGGYGWVVYRGRRYCPACGVRFDVVKDCDKDA